MEGTVSQSTTRDGDEKTQLLQVWELMDFSPPLSKALEGIPQHAKERDEAWAQPIFPGDAGISPKIQECWL